MVRLARVHPRKHHREAVIIARYTVALLPTVHIFLLHREVAFVRTDVLIGRKTILECGDSGVYRSTGFVDTVARKVRGRTVAVRVLHVVGRVPIVSRSKRAVTVLLAVQVGEQSKEVLRVVLVHGRIGRRTHHNQCKRAVSHQDHGHRKRAHIQLPPALLPAPPKGTNDQGNHQCDVHRNTRIKGQSHAVYKGQLKPGCKLHKALNQSVLYKQQQRQRQGHGTNESGPLEFISLEIIHGDDGRNGQQIQQVNPNGEPHEICDKHNPTQVTRLF